MHHFTEELWIQIRMIGTIFSPLYLFFFLPETKHAACSQVDSTAMMRPFVSVVCLFRGNGGYCTTEPLMLQENL